jgi:glycosyltransferase involved in cell wall biosynthesis
MREVGDKERVAPRVALVGPPLAASGGIGRVMTYLLETLPAEHQPVEVLDTRGSARHPVLSVFPLLRVLWRLSTLLFRRRVDVVHVNISSHGSTLRKLAIVELVTRLRRPCVLHLHASSYPEFYASLPRTVASLVRRGFGRATIVVALGASWRDYVVEVLHVDPARVAVLPNAVPGPATLVPLRRGPDEPTHVVFLGRLGERKGTGDLLQALARIPEALRWRATIAGDGARAGYESQAAELGIGGGVRLPGWVGADETSELLATAHVLALPSRAEGLPMSVLEALAYGVPPLTTPVGSIPEVIRDGDNGRLVPVGDVSALADALTELCAHEDDRHALAAAARRTWELNFRIDDYAERIVEIWAQARDAGRPRAGH